MSTSGVRAAFDVTSVISGGTGIARYVTELGTELESRGVDLRRFALGRQSHPAPPHTKRVRVPARLIDAWWHRIAWPPIESLVGAADLVHATGLTSVSTRLPLVVTVHDVAAVRYPELHPPRHVRQQQAQLRALERAAAIVTVSAATADDLVHLGIERERLVVSPLGLTGLDRAPAEAGNRPAGYLLTVGETSPRKGYEVVLRALARLGEGVRLVMAGPPAGAEEHLSSLITRLGLTSVVTRLGAVSDSDLASLYQGAIGLCFPSISEGFGLPVLEAMAAGVPVLASDIAATRELAADAALYLPTGDDQAWAEAIEALTSDERLRTELGERGRVRASEFTWRRTAEATLEAYRLALGQGP
jgi:glycosyltransferase involved in cell wall biosynthesis